MIFSCGNQTLFFHREIADAVHISTERTLNIVHAYLSMKKLFTDHSRFPFIEKTTTLGIEENAILLR